MALLTSLNSSETACKSNPSIWLDFTDSILIQCVPVDCRVFPYSCYPSVTQNRHQDSLATTLTARFVESLKPSDRRIEHFDGMVRGLALRLSPTGAKCWVLLYRMHRRLRRWTIGTYPTLSLADAREQARWGLREMELGRDPALAKRETREADTVGDLVKRYVEEYAKPKKRSWKDDRRLLGKHVLPTWRHRAAREIRRRDVRDLIQMVAQGGAPITANRLRALLHKVFVFAVEQELVETNPVLHVPRPGVERQRDRVLTADELRMLWQKLGAESPPMAAAFRLRLLTAQRGGEVHGLRWADLDLSGAWWTIPGESSKNGLPHRVPLTAPVLKMLRDLRATARPDAVYVLEGARGKRQLSEATTRLAIPDFRGHDLRRTAASYMASAGISRLVISKILNHVDKGVTAVYDRHSYDAEKRTALETWARTLAGILKQKKQRSADVVPIGRGR